MPNPGVLIADKPAGPASHDVVNLVRWGTGIRKSGHTGALDAHASGILLILLGSVTRLAEYLLEVNKEDLATVQFVATTSTSDAAGRITPTRPFSFPEDALAARLLTFVGKRLQAPLVFSAIGANGRKAYTIIRNGEDRDVEDARAVLRRTP